MKQRREFGQAKKKGSFTGMKGSRLLFITAACVFVISSVLLIRYYAAYLASRETSREMRELYYSGEVPSDEISSGEASPVEAPAASKAPSGSGRALPRTADDPDASAPIAEDSSPVPAAADSSPSSPAPDGAAYDAGRPLPVRFRLLRDENPDIAAWLTIDKQLDEPVVLRDNSYYLDRDSRGRKNSNGALFLDEKSELNSRPRTLLIYGHNMKSEAMFGILRRYDSLSYYKQHPVFAFDTIYDDGRYVIFAVGTMGTRPGSDNFVGLPALLSRENEQRESGIDRLRALSVWSVPVDVKPDDDMVLLITCTSDDDERRFVAARRIRGYENEAGVIQTVQETKIK